MSRTDDPFAEDQRRAWEQAMIALEDDLGTHTRAGGPTWREVYKNTPAVDVWRRSPTRPPAAKLEGDALKKAREIAEVKVTLARNAYELAQSELDALSG
jgi:hypothetical protein